MTQTELDILLSGTNNPLPDEIKQEFAELAARFIDAHGLHDVSQQLAVTKLMADTTMLVGTYILADFKKGTTL